MSVDSGGDAAVIEVGQNTNMAGAIEAAKLNDAAAKASQAAVGQIAAETQKTHGQEQAAKHEAAAAPSGNSGYDSPSHSSGSSDKGNVEGQVYGEGLTQILGETMGGSAIIEGMQMIDSVRTEDAASGYGGTTFDKDIAKTKRAPGVYKSEAAESTSVTGEKSSISTTSAFGLVSKSNLAGGALSGDTGNTKSWSIGKSSSELTQKLTLTKAKNFKLEQGAGNAMRKQEELSGQIRTAGMKYGMGSGVVAKLQKDLHFKPNDSLGSEPVSTSTTTDWA